MDKPTCHAFAQDPATLPHISNVSYFHATRLNIHLCLGFQRQNSRSLQYALFLRPITPPHDSEINFPPVIAAIWWDLNSGLCSLQKIPCWSASAASATSRRTLVLFAGYLFSRCFVVSLPVTRETQESYGSCLLAVRLIKGGFVVAAVLLVLRRSQKLLLWQQLLDPPKWVRLSSTQKFIFNVPCGTDALHHE